MSQESIASRVENLERDMENLKSKILTPRKKDWRRVVGRFANDAGGQEIFSAAMKLRAADRARAKSRRAAPKRPKASK